MPGDEWEDAPDAQPGALASGEAGEWLEDDGAAPALAAPPDLRVPVPGVAVEAGPLLPDAPVPAQPAVAVPVPAASSGGQIAGVAVPGARLDEPEATPSGRKKERVVRKRKAGRSLTGSNFRMTDRDKRILAFLGRYRCATVGQLARRFQTSETALRNRLPRMEREGLITWAWAAQSKPKIWLVTESGLRTVGMNLTAPNVSWGQLRHTLGLVDMGVTFELAGEIVLTEREIRAAATRYTPTPRMRVAIDLTLPQGSVPPVGGVDGFDGVDDSIGEAVRTALVVPALGRSFGHIPDMVLVRQPFPSGQSGNIAVELELTRKSLSEWKNVLTAYVGSPAFHEVYYFYTSSEVRKGMLSVVRALGAENKIKMVPFTPIDNTADPTVSGG